MRLLKIIINIIGEPFMKTTQTKILFSSVLFSAAISSIMFPAEEIPLEVKIKKEQADPYKQKQTNCDLTALKLLQLQNNAAAVKLPIKSRANVYKRTNPDYTALDSTRCSAATEPLLKIQSSIDEKKENTDDQTSKVKALIYAAGKGDQEMLTLLLVKKKFDINRRDNYSGTALICLTNQEFTEAVKLLLANRADVNQQNYEDGPTPLTIAATNGNSEITKLLLTNNADVNKKIENNRTALMFAAGHDHPKIVELLLANKAAANEYDNKGYTPLIFAKDNDNPEIVALLTCEKN